MANHTGTVRSTAADSTGAQIVIVAERAGVDDAMPGYRRDPWRYRTEDEWAVQAGPQHVYYTIQEGGTALTTKDPAESID